MEKLDLNFWGVMSLVSRKTGMSQSYTSQFFRGERHLSHKKATILADFFKERGIDITKEDLVFNIKKGEKLTDFYERKLESQKQSNQLN